MSRLLQGEVGSGKTIVALRAMLQVVDSGRQCALLRRLKYLPRNIIGHSGDAGSARRGRRARVWPISATRIVLLTGSLPVPAKRASPVGRGHRRGGHRDRTHALIQDTVEFFDLGMVVIDEQHRFGVEQRDALRARPKVARTHICW